jgi:hypothetical protein
MHTESYWKQNRKQSSPLWNDDLIQCVKWAGKNTKVEMAGVMTYVMKVWQFLLEDLRKKIKIFY